MKFNKIIPMLLILVLSLVSCKQPTDPVGELNYSNSKREIFYSSTESNKSSSSRFEEARGRGYPVDNEGYPYITRMNQDIFTSLDQISNNPTTTTDMEAGADTSLEVDDHNQSIVRTPFIHGISNFFITRSETDSGDGGQILKYFGSESNFTTGLGMYGLLNNEKWHTNLRKFTTEQHPSQAAWLPGLLTDYWQFVPGYLFVASERTKKINIYYYNQGFVNEIGSISTGMRTAIVSIHRKGDYYWLLSATYSGDQFNVYVAHKTELFTPEAVIPAPGNPVLGNGGINIGAFKLLPNRYVDFPSGIELGENATLVQDSENDFYLLATKNDNKTTGKDRDRVLVYSVHITNPTYKHLESHNSYGANLTISSQIMDKELWNNNKNYLNGTYFPNCSAGGTFSTDVYGQLFFNSVAHYSYGPTIDNKYYIRVKESVGGRIIAPYISQPIQPYLFNGDYTIRSQEDVDRFDGYTTITGNLTIENTDLESIVLSNLTRVEGNLTIIDNNSLIHTGGLMNVSFIGGNLEIKKNNSLESLWGFWELTSINGDLIIWGNPSLPYFDGLDTLTSVNGDLCIMYNDTLTHIGSLSNIETIGGDFRIVGNKKFEQMDRIGSSTTLGLTSIGGDLGISSNASLPNLVGLDNLTSVKGKLNINSNNALKNLSGLGNISTIGGDLEIHGNKHTRLGSLAGLERLTSIGGSLKIYGLTYLNNLAGFDNLAIINKNLQITGNTALPTTTAQEFADGITINGSTTISGNYTE